MIPNQDLDVLTEAMSARHGRRPLSQTDVADADPFILFLGNECALAAKVPDLESIADQAFNLLGGSDEALAQSIALAGDEGKPNMLKALYNLLDKMSGGLAYTMLQSLYLNIPVPLFYQDLAQLVKAGYFNRIITTNFDTLLEQALDGAGMQAGFDYFVTSLGIKSGEGEDTSPDQSADDAPSEGDDREPVHIIKLHGDLAQQQINLSPGRIQRALQSQRRFVKSELKGDIIMVGYRFENDKVNDWLASTSTSREQLWWVRPDGPQRDINDWASVVSFIDGEAGRPESFFSQLVLRLLRRPVLESLSKSFKDYAAGAGVEIEETLDQPAQQAMEASYGEDDQLVIELRDKIRHSQSVLFGHEQSSATGERPPNVQTQIDYQKRHIAKFEDKLRELPGCRERIIELVNLIESDAERAGDRLKPGTLDFLRQQIYALLREYEFEQPPNQQVIAAAICATVMLADRLRVETGGEAFSLKTLRELATYVPSLAARGVI